MRRTDQRDRCNLPTSDDRADFTRLYETEFQQQFRTARLILGSTALAEDVVHQAFLAVWLRWDTIADPGPYLQRSVINSAKSRQTTTARQRRILESQRPIDSARPCDNDYLVDALAELPFNQRAAIVLRFYAGLPNTEIAEALCCPPGSIGPWLQRGLEHLRKDLS